MCSISATDTIRNGKPRCIKKKEKKKKSLNSASFPFHVAPTAAEKTSGTPKCHLLLTSTLMIIADSEKSSTGLAGRNA